MRGAMEADSDRDGEVELPKLFEAQKILSEFQILDTRLFKMLKFWFCFAFIVLIEDNIKPERITNNYFWSTPSQHVEKMRYIIPILTIQSQKNYKNYFLLFTHTKCEVSSKLSSLQPRRWDKSLTIWAKGQKEEIPKVARKIKLGMSCVIF